MTDHMTDHRVYVDECHIVLQRMLESTYTLGMHISNDTGRHLYAGGLQSHTHTRTHTHTPHPANWVESIHKTTRTCFAHTLIVSQKTTIANYGRRSSLSNYRINITIIIDNNN